MATYVPNAFDKTQPTEDKFVQSAAEEFRTVKDPVIRALRFPSVDDAAVNMGELPAAADRAGKFLSFDMTTGQPTAASVLPGTVPVSTFGQSLVNTANASNARALLMVPGQNFIDNGEIIIAQRGVSVAAVGSGLVAIDRWKWAFNGTGVVTISQEAVSFSQAAFRNAMKITVTTADAAIAAGDTYAIVQRIEGYTSRPLIGVPLFLSFWVKASVAGIYCIALRNSANDRSYIVEYTINAANVDEQKFVALPAGLDVSGGTWNFTSGYGVEVAWILACGSTFHNSANSWLAGNFLATANQVNLMGTVANSFQITGVKLERSEIATPFEFKGFQKELMAAQRQVCKTYDYNVAPGTITRAGAIQTSRAYSTGATLLTPYFPYPVEMRANPTMVAFNADTGGSGTWQDSGLTPRAVNFLNVGTRGCNVTNTGSIMADSVLIGHILAVAEL